MPSEGPRESASPRGAPPRVRAEIAGRGEVVRSEASWRNRLRCCGGGDRRLRCGPGQCNGRGGLGAVDHHADSFLSCQKATNSTQKNVYDADVCCRNGTWSQVASTVLFRLADNFLGKHIQAVDRSSSGRNPLVKCPRPDLRNFQQSSSLCCICDSYDSFLLRSRNSGRIVKKYGRLEFK